MHDARNMGCLSLFVGMDLPLHKNPVARLVRPDNLTFKSQKFGAQCFLKAVGDLLVIFGGNVLQENLAIPVQDFRGVAKDLVVPQ